MSCLNQIQYRLSLPDYVNLWSSLVPNFTAAEFASILTTETHFTCLEAYVLRSIIVLVSRKLMDKPEQSQSCHCIREISAYSSLCRTTGGTETCCGVMGICHLLLFTTSNQKLNGKCNHDSKYFKTGACSETPAEVCSPLQRLAAHCWLSWHIP